MSDIVSPAHSVQQVLENISEFEKQVIADQAAELEKQAVAASSSGNLVRFFLEVYSSLRVGHWKTVHYAQHMAYDKISDEIGDIADKMIETYQGNGARIAVPTSLDIYLITNKFIEDCIAKLRDHKNFGISDRDIDLLNLRDEAIGCLNQLKYLLSLKG